MKMIDLQIFYVDGKEIVVGSYEESITPTTFKHICRISNDNGVFDFEGEVNEDLDLVMKRLQEAYKEHLREKLMKVYKDLDIKTEILAVLN